MTGASSSGEPVTGRTHGAHGATREVAPVTAGFVRGRAMLVHLLLVAFAAAVVWRSATVQLVAADRLKARADSLAFSDIELPAPRGAIFDARGEPLATTREVFRVVITPDEVRHVAGPKEDSSEAQRLAVALERFGVSRRVIARAMDGKGRYLPLPEPLLASQLQTIWPLRGVRAYRATDRVPPSSPGMRRIVGVVDTAGRGRSGLERSLDSILLGTRGTRRTVRDRSGRVLESPARESDAARAGHSVQLTINARLQEIVERALLDAVGRQGADGGDVVVLDPHTGHVLAMAGVRDGKLARELTPVQEAYEPGSVLKPFVVAHLLDRRRVRLDEVLDVHGGRWRPPAVPKTIVDDHKADSLSVFDVVRWSSNVGTAKLVLDRLPIDEEYALLRDLGFGTYTGVPYPAESPGRLPDPEAGEWTVLTPTQLATGYELQVTPLQLAVAYAALANGGEIIEPALVRSIRDADGRSVYTHVPRPLRRVMTAEAAAAARAMLKAVVDSGTARPAALEMYDLGGKTGTAQRVVNRQYDRTHYNATFASIFPMADPQLVIVARLIDPSESIYGGVVTAPLVREVLRDAIAADDAALDRRLLARVARVLPMERLLAATPDRPGRDGRPAASVERGSRSLADGGAPPTRDPIADPDTAARAFDALVPRSAGRVILALPLATDGDGTRGDAPSIADGGTAAARAVANVPVPDVTGLPLRSAARRLHAAGFQVELPSASGAASGALVGVVQRSRPAAGTRARRGTIVRLEAGR